MIEVLNAIKSTALFLIKTVPIIAVAMFFTSQLIKRGVIDYISDRFSKLNLSGIAIATASTCFLSPLVAYSMLSQAWKEGKVDEREIIAISFLSSFPSMFSHLYTFFIPFVIPILGFAGIVYTLTRLYVAIVKTVIGYVLASRFKSKVKVVKRDIDYPVLKNLKRVLPVIALTYFTASVINNYGFFELFDRVLYFIPLNPKAIGIAIVEVFNFRAAVVLAANLMDNGLGIKWVVVGLILGNVISLSARSVRHSLPIHLSLFGRLGVKIVLLNSFVTMLLDLILILIILSI